MSEKKEATKEEESTIIEVPIKVYCIHYDGPKQPGSDLPETIQMKNISKEGDIGVWLAFKCPKCGREIGIETEPLDSVKADQQDTSTWVCKVCGCTDTTPCVTYLPGAAIDTCHWVRKNLCSKCADKAKAKETTKTDAP